jgi:hypothetical protein
MELSIIIKDLGRINMKWRSGIRFSIDPIKQDYNGLAFEPIRGQNANMNKLEKGDVLTNDKYRLIYKGSVDTQHIGRIWTTAYIFEWINNDPTMYIPTEELLESNWRIEGE